MNETTQALGNKMIQFQTEADSDSIPRWVIALGILVLAALIAFIYRRKARAMPSAVAVSAADRKTPPSDNPENISAERDRVLRMLEAGKITAQESADLLNALSHPRPAAQKTKVGLAAPAKMLLVGAALVLIGFFLPWFRFNLAAEMQHAMSQFGANGGGGLLGGSGNGQGVLGGFPGNAMVTASGGDIKNGLGWIVLLLGLAAAVMPYLASTMDFQMLKKVKLVMLGIGALVLVYLSAEGIRWLHVGILAVLLGYALEITGALKEKSA